MAGDEGDGTIGTNGTDQVKSAAAEGDGLGQFPRDDDGSEQDWDDWSVPRDGSSSNNMSFNVAGGAGLLQSEHVHPTRGGTRDVTGSPKRRKKKSDFSGRLKQLEATAFRKVDDSKSMMAMSTGGLLLGKSRDAKSRLDALVLERSNSDSKLNGKKKKKDRDKDKDGDLSSPKHKSSNDSKTRKTRRERRATDFDTRRSRSSSNDSKRRKTRPERRATDSEIRRSRSSSTNRRMSAMIQTKKMKSVAHLDIMRDMSSGEATSNRKKSKESTLNPKKIPEETPRRKKKNKDNLSFSSHETKQVRTSSRSGRRSKMTTAKAKSMSHLLMDVDISSEGESSSQQKKKKREKLKSIASSDNEKEKGSFRKEKKKKRSKSDANVGDDGSLSVASTLGSADQSMESSKISPLGSSSPRSKKKKEKLKKTKRDKSTPDVPPPPVDDDNEEEEDINATLEKFAEEIRLSKEGQSDKSSSVPSTPKVKEHAKKSSADNESSKTPGNQSTEDAFENAWASGKKGATDPGVTEAITQAADALKAASVDMNTFERTSEGDQREEVLRLQQQLSEALQKVVVMSEEQIQDKDQFLKASAELTRLKAELAEALQERGELVEELKDRDRIIEEERDRIDKLEQAIEKQLDTQDALEVKLEKSEDEIEKLLMEVQDLEGKLENGESGGGASLAELRETKNKLSEKEAEVATQKERIEKLEDDLKNSLTVPQLQIEELDAENKALQGKLKGERLDFSTKLAAKDDLIAKLQEEVGAFNASSDAQDLISARQKLNEARADANMVREDLEAANKMIEELQGEREDLVRRNETLKESVVGLENNVKELIEKSESLNSKVLEWTEKTYSWKQRAETAERKLEVLNDDKSDFGASEESGDAVDEAPQGLLLQAAMDKNADKKKNKWNIFRKDGEGQDLSAEDIRIRTLEDRNQTLEDMVAELRSEIVKIQTAHKEERYTTQKKIAQLEGENEALSLQNETLEQLSRSQQ